MSRPNLIPIPLVLTAAFACMSACLTNVPDPELGGVYACEIDDDCPGTQSCLQKTCETVALPDLHINNPEVEEVYAFGGGGTPHSEILSVSATNLVLRSRSASNEAVPGEGHLVVFVDEVQVGTIEMGDLSGGVQMEIAIPDVPGVHRIRVQARLNDGTDYDNDQAAARTLVWVDDGRQHIAISEPWLNETFTLESQLINAEVVGLNGIEIGPPMSELFHVHIFYDQPFPACLEDPLCVAGYNGVVPNDMDDFGPVLLPESGAGTKTLTAVVMNPDHTLYTDDMDEPVFSSIEIIRTNN